MYHHLCYVASSGIALSILPIFSYELMLNNIYHFRGAFYFGQYRLQSFTLSNFNSLKTIPHEIFVCFIKSATKVYHIELVEGGACLLFSD